MLEILNQVINFFKKEKISTYPPHFILIKFTDVALENGVLWDENKIIERHFINRFGNSDKKTYQYSEEEVYILNKAYNIPIYDLTKVNPTLAVYSKVEPGQVKYEQ